MDDAREHWMTGLFRAAGLALAGFLLMASLAVIGNLSSHAPGLPTVRTTEVAPDAIRRTAQLLDVGDRWSDARSVSSSGPFEEAPGLVR